MERILNTYYRGTGTSRGNNDIDSRPIALMLIPPLIIWIEVEILNYCSGLSHLYFTIRIRRESIIENMHICCIIKMNTSFIFLGIGINMIPFRVTI